MTVHTITANELHQKMENGEKVFILDVRNPEDYEEWKIEGKHVESANIPYFDFLDEDENVYAPLPKDTEIVAVCAKGGSSLMVAEQLAERGYQVSSLDEGMLAWSQFYKPTPVVDEPGLKLIQFNRLAKGCLSYMIISGGEAVVVDANRHVSEYLRVAKQENANIVHVLDTHLHADHISGGVALAKEVGAKYWIAPEETEGAKFGYESLQEGQLVLFGTSQLEVVGMRTPGHTVGSTSFLIDDKYLLTGDTLFVSGLGRSDLKGRAKEMAEMMFATVTDKISKLRDDLIILPGHYADAREINDAGYVGATMAEIRKNNPILHMKNKQAFVETAVGNVGVTPPNHDKIIAVNRGQVETTVQEQTEMEIGPNRCAVHS